MNGMTDGLLEEEQLENDLVDLLCTDLDKFDSFYEEHKDWKKKRKKEKTFKKR